MSLVACRECGAQVASSARTCPGCGVADPEAGQHRAAMSASVLLVVVLAVVGVAVVFAAMAAMGV